MCNVAATCGLGQIKNQITESRGEVAGEKQHSILPNHLDRRIQTSFSIIHILPNTLWQGRIRLFTLSLDCVRQPRTAYFPERGECSQVIVILPVIFACLLVGLGQNNYVSNFIFNRFSLIYSIVYTVFTCCLSFV